MKEVKFSERYGFGWTYPNTRNDGDRYDCYVVMGSENHTVAFQFNGVRYAYPAIFDQQEMIAYSQHHKAIFGLEPEVIPCSGKCPICHGDMANTDGNWLRCLSCGYEIPRMFAGTIPGQATQCDYCGRINDLSEHKSACPGCGAPITGKKLWGG